MFPKEYIVIPGICFAYASCVYLEGKKSYRSQCVIIKSEHT